jgi:GDPmannose 4,6-dehydratase
MQDSLFLGNLSAKRDWGHAKDYVRAMYKVLQHDKPDDFVIATGVTTEVRQFVRMAFAEAGIELVFKGEGVNEKGFVAKCLGEFQLPVGKVVVQVDPAYFRPTEVDLLLGDPSKANNLLGWQPQYDLKALVNDMMQSDLKLARKDKYLKDGGFRVNNYFE